MCIRYTFPGLALVGLRGCLFFVTVNQVLVRLWARRRSQCLTGKCRPSGLWLPCDFRQLRSGAFANSCTS
jgi:hypothetical protein